MIAVILAGGKGLRMEPLTGSLPKQLLKIGNQTLIELLLEKLVSVGITEHIITVLSQTSPLTATLDRIAERKCDMTKIESRGSKVSDLVYSLQEALERQKDVCVTMGDLVFFGQNLEEFIQKGIPKGIDIVVGFTTKSEGVSGVRLIGNITGFTRDETGDNRFSSGVYLITVKGCRTIVNAWDSMQPKMHILMSQAIAHLNSLTRTLDGGYDVNTPYDYQNILSHLDLIKVK